MIIDKKIWSVTDLSSYLYCPRKFFLEKIEGLRQPPTRPMIEGRIRHEIRERFSKVEKDIVEGIEKVNQTLVHQAYKQVLDNIINQVFEKDSRLIFGFKIDEKELRDKIIESMDIEIDLRVKSILKTGEKGFIGKELWKNLEPKYLSEVQLFSDKLGLKGRADRVMIEADEVIPFELKTRAIQKVWPSDEIQLAAYTMLLEEKYEKEIPYGVLEAGNKRHRIKIDYRLKKKVIETIEILNNLKVNPEYPNSFAKCKSCVWKKECDDL